MDRQPRLASALAGFMALAVVAAVVVACGGAATSTPAAATSTPPAGQPSAPTGDAASVRIADFAFAPAALTVTAGTSVTWTNDDSARHSIAWDDGSAGSGALGTGGTYSRTFDTPGTFAYACGIHPNMKGTVVVEP